ncbi:MAG: hypothetical protein MUF27_13375, partial [Acidobacteria bacterium]|nr:hypothetical protein [Acidobacteriota bacterium]
MRSSCAIPAAIPGRHLAQRRHPLADPHLLLERQQSGQVLEHDQPADRLAGVALELRDGVAEVKLLAVRRAAPGPFQPDPAARAQRLRGLGQELRRQPEHLRRRAAGDRGQVHPRDRAAGRVQEGDQPLPVGRQQ